MCEPVKMPVHKEWYKFTGAMRVAEHWPLSRYTKLRVAHAPGLPGTFSLPSRVRDPDMYYGTCVTVTHVPWWMSGSLPSDYLWSRHRIKRSWHSRCMFSLQFSQSGKRPIGYNTIELCFKLEGEEDVSFLCRYTIFFNKFSIEMVDFL